MYTADTTLVSYVPKTGAAAHEYTAQGEEHQWLGASKARNEVDNLYKLVTTYSCKRKTLRWPLVIFFDMLDICAYNAFVIWMSLSPEWGKLQKRHPQHW